LIVKRFNPAYATLWIALGLAMLTTVGGCETGGQTGALTGAGIGALVGQAAGGDTEATLIGAAVGSGVGYIIGNEADKKKAREMSEQTRPDDYRHTEVEPLGGTRWQVIDINPDEKVDPFTSMIVEFDADGRVSCTTTRDDGTVDVSEEHYRVVGNTLIINKPGYLINARWAIEGDQLVLDASDFSAVLTRLRS
jgi:uncharacterized protein YcfJ